MTEYYNQEIQAELLRPLLDVYASIYKEDKNINKRWLITFEYEMTENPGVEITMPNFYNPDVNIIEAYYSIYINFKFDPDHLGVKIDGKYYICPTL